MDQVNLAAKLATFGDHWQPRTIARFNDCDIMVVKAQGEFVWHKHDDTDDFFLVLKGHLTKGHLNRSQCSRSRQLFGNTAITGKQTSRTRPARSMRP